MKKAFSVFGLLLVSCYSFGQQYIEPVVGYQADLNNLSQNFQQLNTGVQYAQKVKNDAEWTCRFQLSWPLAHRTSDSSFTSDPALPLYEAAQKKILPIAITLETGLRLKIIGKSSRKGLSVILNTGLTYQNTSVKYTYDKSNYTILNPDRSQQLLRPFLSGGFEYLQQTKSGGLFAQLVILSPVLAKKYRYPSTYSYMTPLSLTVGYSIALVNKTDEK